MAFAFALREHVHRPAISQECGLQRVDSDAFGDLRHCRNAILHDNGMLEKGATALTVLGKGDAMEPANDELHDVFGQLAPALNDAGLTCYGEDPGFERERGLNAWQEATTLQQVRVLESRFPDTSSMLRLVAADVLVQSVIEPGFPSRPRRTCRMNPE